MNMKKIIAGAVASVMAVSTLAIAASAEALSSKTGNEESAVNYDVDFSGLTEDQIKSITKIEADISVTSNFLNGCIGYNDAAAGWTPENKEISAENDGTTGTWTLEVDAGDFAALDDDGAIAPFAQIQFWWVNPLHDEEGNDTEDPGVAELTYVGLFDKDGNVVKEAGSRASDPGTDDPGTDDPGTDDPQTPPNTGVEGVAVVVGLAVLATGALVVAKKRK